MELGPSRPVRHIGGTAAEDDGCTVKTASDLATANRHIAEREAQIAQQAEIVRELGANGHDTANARGMLRFMQRNLDVMIAASRACQSWHALQLAKPPRLPAYRRAREPTYPLLRRRPVRRRRRLPFEGLASFVDLQSRLLEMNHPLGELLASVIWRVLLEDPAQEGAAASNRPADREGKLVAEGSVGHMFW